MEIRTLCRTISVRAGWVVLLAGLLAGCVTAVPNETISPLPAPTLTVAEVRATETPAPATATPTPTPEPSNLASLATASASSQLRTDRLGDYGAASAIDGSLGTPWCEGAAGDGSGEWIELTFPNPVEVTAIGVDVGYDRLADDADHPERLFTENQRLKQASLIFSDEQQAMVVFEDIRGVQKVSLADAPGGPIVTSSIRLIIDEVYSSERFQDTCIAEIEVWGRRQ